MAQAYSDPRRESETYALPDMEVWSDAIANVYTQCCGDFEVGLESGWVENQVCPNCEREAPKMLVKRTKRTGWFYWFCFPGCLPDSEPFGPFESREAALADAREGMDDDIDLDAGEGSGF